MTNRHRLGSIAATIIAMAACQSVHTQGQPEVITNQSAIGSPSPSPSSLDPSNVPSTSPMETSSELDPATPTPSPTATATPKPTPRPVKHAYNSIETNRKVVAMTFDDGPHASLTPQLLDILKARNIRATFYVVGRNVAEYPDIMKRMVEEGHEIGNHTWSHPSLTRLGATGVKSQMDRTTEIIQKTTGVTPKTMRPPYGATNSSLNKRLDTDYGMKVIMWSVDPLDWKYRNADRVTSAILKGAHPGAIILAHDIHKSTISAMPGTLDRLRAQGYDFVTVSELLAMEYGDEPVAEPASAATEDSPTIKSSGESFRVQRIEDSSESIR